MVTPSTGCALFDAIILPFGETTTHSTLVDGDTVDRAWMMHLCGTITRR